MSHQGTPQLPKRATARLTSQQQRARVLERIQITLNSRLTEKSGKIAKKKKTPAQQSPGFALKNSLDAGKPQAWAVELAQQVMDPLRGVPPPTSQLQDQLVEQVKQTESAELDVSKLDENDKKKRLVDYSDSEDESEAEEDGKLHGGMEH